MPSYIAKIEIIGIYNLFDITQEFCPGVNIIYAGNGSGKTTLLHCIVNILNGDYSRFLYIDFFRIRTWFDDDNFVTIYNENYQGNQEPSIRVCVNSDRRGVRITEQINEFEQLEDEIEETEETQIEQDYFYKFDYTQTKVLLPAAYFPAFRTMIEGWQAVEQNTSTDKLTTFVRNTFGKFSPLIEYPTPKDIEQSLINEIQEITTNISQIDRQIMAQISIEYLSASLRNELNVNIDSFENIIEEIKTIFLNINDFPISDESYISSSEIYMKIIKEIESNIITNNNMKYFVNFLIIYRKSLNELLLIITDKFRLLYKYLSTVNNMLKGKK